MFIKNDHQESNEEGVILTSKLCTKSGVIIPLLSLSLY